MRFGNDHNQVMNELEKQTRVLQDIEKTLASIADTMQQVAPTVHTTSTMERFSGQPERHQPTSNKP